MRIHRLAELAFCLGNAPEYFGYNFSSRVKLRLWLAMLDAPKRYWQACKPQSIHEIRNHIIWLVAINE